MAGSAANTPQRRLGYDVIKDPITGQRRARVYRLWSEAESTYLETNWGRTPIGTMVKHLRRNPTAIERQAERMGLRKLSEDYGYTAVSVAMIVGRDERTVARWIVAGKLKATRRHTERADDPWAVTAKDLRAFVLRYPSEVNPGRSFGEGCWHLLVDILANKGHGAGEFGERDSREDDPPPVTGGAPEARQDAIEADDE